MLMTDLWLIQRRRGERIRSPLHLFLSLHTFRDSLARTASASQCCLGAPVYVSSIMHRTKWLSPTAQCQNERTAKDVEGSWNGISCAVQVEKDKSGHILRLWSASTDKSWAGNCQQEDEQWGQNRNKTKLRLDEVPTKRQKAERRWKLRHHYMLNVKQKTSYKKTLWLKSDSIETKSLILFRQLVLPEDVQLWTYSYGGQRFCYAAWSQTAAQ